MLYKVRYISQIDKNYGMVDEFRELVDTLHAQGIRVIFAYRHEWNGWYERGRVRMPDESRLMRVEPVGLNLAVWQQPHNRGNDYLCNIL